MGVCPICTQATNRKQTQTHRDRGHQSLVGCCCKACLLQLVTAPGGQQVSCNCSLECVIVNLLHLPNHFLLTPLWHNSSRQGTKLVIYYLTASHGLHATSTETPPLAGSRLPQFARIVCGCILLNLPQVVIGSIPFALKIYTSFIIII